VTIQNLMGPSDETALVAAEERLRRILRDLAVVQDAVEQLEYEIIMIVNELGMSLDSIGEAHDPPISRQAVRKRYSHPKPRRRRGDG